MKPSRESRLRGREGGGRYGVRGIDRSHLLAKNYAGIIALAIAFPQNYFTEELNQHAF